MPLVRRIDKYCLDSESEHKAYEALINDPSITVIKEKEIIGQGLAQEYIY